MGCGATHFGSAADADGREDKELPKRTTITGNDAVDGGVRGSDAS